ncbi:hypothetical protein [Sphingorhabdus sp. Alg239-R122]|uniref:hypothetical protein n=1 Tax=Sphingorhabdus sp. Alg239-R122 TaxID=2305989 RepID=UPI0013DBF703|nr:hypothetical protein [Sphingorhabdus sp. Alg239-R122]
MDINSAFITFSCISIASIGLALIIGTGSVNREKLVAGLNIFGFEAPAQKREREAKLKEMTRTADQAMAARERGERPTAMHYG